MSDKLLPVFIFITIYAKSSYSLSNRDKNNYTIRNVNSSALWRNSDRFINNSEKKNGQIISAPRKHNISSNNNTSQYSQSRSMKPRGLIDGFLNFITGGFIYSFLQEEKKDKPKVRRNKRIRKPPFDYDSEGDYDFDPIGSFLDGLENMFDSKEKSQSSVEYTGNKNHVSVTTQTESYEDVSSSTEEIDYSTENLQEDSYSTEYPDESAQSTLSDEEYDDSTSYEVPPTNFGTSTQPSTKYKTSPFGTTYAKHPQTNWQTSTATTILKRKPTRSKVTSTTTTTTTTTTTPKPVRRIPRPTRKTNKWPTKTSTEKLLLKSKVTMRPYIITSRPQIYKRPEYKLSVQAPAGGKQDCNTTTTTVVKPKPWLPNFLNPNLWNDKDTAISSNTISDTTTKAPGGWLDIFGDDTDDDDPTEPAQQSSTGSWFSNIFGDSESTTTSTTTSTSPPTTTASPATNPPQASWFNALVNAEEDDGAYSQVVNGSHKIKKGFKRSYEGYQLVRISTKGIGGMKTLLSMQEDMDNPGLTWWSVPSMKRPADLLVSPDMLQEVKDHLEAEDLNYHVLIQDLQKAISFENPKLSKTQRLELERQRGHPLTWRRYHRYADILRYLEYLSLKYPQYVDLIPLGRSSEGLPLVVVKVSYSEQNSSRKGSNNNDPIYKKWKLKPSNSRPAIWIDAGMHAREWIAPAVATWFLHALVEGEQGEGADIDVLKLADWYILPVGNPDGYEYSHTKDRLWSKTRSKHPPNENSLQSWLPWNWVDPDCVGVDPNRNWDYHWNEKGGSKNPCSDFYAGPYAFSEPETKLVSTFLMENRDRIKLYLTLQSYTQMLLIPMTHSAVSFVDEIDVMEMGKLAVRVITDTSESGTKYDIGTTADVLQPLSGTSYDWAKGIAGIKYSYGIKLRDAKGPHGFLLPGSEIIPTGIEIWEAVKAMAFNLN